MSYVETKDLKLIYFDSLELSRAARGAHVHQLARVAAPDVRLGAVRIHDRPAEGLRRTTATPHQYSAPHSRLVFDVAPLSHAFETFPASERMFSLMNHEMVHVVHRRHRVRGGPALAALLPRQGHAASAESGNAALQLPDDPALHRAALVDRGRRGVHGNVDGRRRGPRAGRLRRDGVPGDGARRRPLLRSARSRFARRSSVDFQIGANAYLYGTRFFTYLAYTYSPEKVVAWIRRDEGSQRYYCRPVSSRCSAFRSSRRGRTGSPSSASSSGSNLAEVRKFPITPHAEPGRHARSARCPGCTTTSRPACSTAPSACPAWSSTSAR